MPCIALLHIKEGMETQGVPTGAACFDFIWAASWPAGLLYKYDTYGLRFKLGFRNICKMTSSGEELQLRLTLSYELLCIQRDSANLFLVPLAQHSPPPASRPAYVQ
jgi:hypothetical protein